MDHCFAALAVGQGARTVGQARLHVRASEAWCIGSDYSDCIASNHFNWPRYFLTYRKY